MISDSGYTCFYAPEIAQLSTSFTRNVTLTNKTRNRLHRLKPSKLLLLQVGYWCILAYVDILSIYNRVNVLECVHSNKLE